MNEIVRENSAECSLYVRASYFLEKPFSSWLYDNKVLRSTGMLLWRWLYWMNQEPLLNPYCLELSKSAANKVLGDSFMYADIYPPASHPLDLYPCPFPGLQFNGRSI